MLQITASQFSLIVKTLQFCTNLIHIKKCHVYVNFFWRFLVAYSMLCRVFKCLFENKWHLYKMFRMVVALVNHSCAD
ncbi:hypothetical protein Vspart_01196 [Vibrio spartinae]|uniref:Uncharacterized protein n=1 Tax=Vibrio spartinae TaxID=1918945 RepID=A0ABX6QXN1_9VIBR|nr:hypothetical protein Vspart_01196 [Vibrio spartinae]